MPWQRRMMQNLKRNRLAVSKLTWGIWQIFTQARESFKNIHFNALFLSRVYIVWAKKSTGELSFMTMKRDTKFGEESTFFSKLTLGTSQILTWALESLKIFHFNGLFSRKVYVVWAKKSTEELSFITLKRDIKFREESTCRFKIDLRNLTNSDLSTRESLKNLHFHLFLLCKVFHVWPKKVQRSFLLWHWWVMQNLKKKMTCGLENDMMNLANFHQSTRKCQNWDFDGILLSKVENVWA